MFCNNSSPKEKIEALKSFLASETNLNSITTWENNDGEEPSDDEDETNYVNIIQSNISALSSNQAQWSPQQFTEEQDLAHNPVEDPAETNYINLINHLSPDIKEMEWLPHASSPVEIPVAGVQSTNSSNTGQHHQKQQQQLQPWFKQDCNQPKIQTLPLGMFQS